MSKMILQQRLRESIELYLRKDNPKPEGCWQQFHLFCQGRGARGRARAQKYLNYLTAEPERSVASLVNKLWTEIRLPHGQGELGTSSQLRKRLLDVFQEFSGVTQHEVHQQNLSTLKTCAAPRLVAPIKALELSSLFSLIEQKLVAMGLLHRSRDHGREVEMMSLKG